jgi:aryl-alcohol dehydrogenase
MRIEAALLEERGGSWVQAELELEEPRGQEVLVRVEATGICHSDLAVRDGDLDLPLPIVLGHEGAGVVEAIGSGVTDVAVGDRVVMSYPFCGACERCLTGRTAYCDLRPAFNLTGRRPDGSTAYRRDGESVFGHFIGQSSFATRALVHHSVVVPVDSDLPAELLAPLGCGVITGAGAVLEALQPRAGSTLAVTGVGAVGQSAVMAARVAGCTTVIAVDTKPERLALACDLGATETIDAREGDLTELLREASGGAGVEFCVDTTGHPAVVAAGYEALAARGTEMVLGVSPAGMKLEFDPWSMLNRTVRGSRQGDVFPRRFIPDLIELHEQGRFPFDNLVSRCGGLADINEAAAAGASGEVVKPVLSLGGGG